MAEPLASGAGVPPRGVGPRRPGGPDGPQPLPCTAGTRPLGESPLHRSDGGRPPRRLVLSFHVPRSVSSLIPRARIPDFLLPQSEPCSSFPELVRFLRSSPSSPGSVSILDTDSPLSLAFCCFAAVTSAVPPLQLSYGGGSLAPLRLPPPPPTNTAPVAAQLSRVV